MRNTIFLAFFIGCMSLYSPFSATCQDTTPRDHRTKKSQNIPVRSSGKTETKKEQPPETTKPFFETAPRVSYHVSCANHGNCCFDASI